MTRTHSSIPGARDAQESGGASREVLAECETPLNYLIQTGGSSPQGLCLAPGESEVFTFQYTVTHDDVFAGESLRNVAKVSGTVYETGDVLERESSVSVCRGSVDVSVVKFVVDNPYPTIGYPVEFALLVENSGEVPATNVVVRDVLPCLYEYEVGSMGSEDESIGTEEVVGPFLQSCLEKHPQQYGQIKTLVWTVPRVAPGQQVRLHFRAVPVSPGAPLVRMTEEEFTNCVEVLVPEQFDSYLGNNVHKLFVPPILPPILELQITKKATALREVVEDTAENREAFGQGQLDDCECPADYNDSGLIVISSGKTPPNVGDKVEFCFSVKNVGPDVGHDVLVVDSLPLGFEYVPGTIGGPPGVALDDSLAAAPERVLKWTIPSIEAVTGCTTGLVFTAKALAWNAQWVEGSGACGLDACPAPEPYVNSATVEGAAEFLEADASNNSASTYFPPAGLVLLKSAKLPETQMEAGAVVEYSFTIVNVGGTPVTNLSLTDDLLGEIAVDPALVLMPGAAHAPQPPVEYAVTQDDVLAEFVENTAKVVGIPLFVDPETCYDLADEGRVVCGRASHRFCTLPVPVGRNPLVLTKRLVAECLQQPPGTQVDKLVPGAGQALVGFELSLSNTTEAETLQCVRVEDRVTYATTLGGEEEEEDACYASRSFPSEWLELESPADPQTGSPAGEAYEWDPSTGVFSWKVDELGPGETRLLLLKFRTNFSDGKQIGNPTEEKFLGFANNASQCDLFDAGNSCGFTASIGDFSPPGPNQIKWHTSNVRAGDGGHSSTFNFYFGREGVSDVSSLSYSRPPDRHEVGYLDSGIIDLSAAQPSGLRLSFRHVLVTADSRSEKFDVASVQISRDGGQQFELLRMNKLGSVSALVDGAVVASPDFEPAVRLLHSSGGVGSNAWITETIPIPFYAGKQVILRFCFDTRDSLNNNAEGWQVDDICVSGTVLNLENQIFQTLPIDLPASKIVNCAKVVSANFQDVEAAVPNLTPPAVCAPICPQARLRVVKTTECFLHPVLPPFTDADPEGKAWFKIELYNDGPSAAHGAEVRESFDPELLTLKQFGTELVVPDFETRFEAQDFPVDPSAVSVFVVGLNSWHSDNTVRGNQSPCAGAPTYYFGLFPDVQQYVGTSFSTMTFVNAIDLTQAKSASLEFCYWSQLAENFDYVSVDVIDQEGSATTLARTGAQSGPVLQNYLPSASIPDDWFQISIPLDNFLGKQIQLRFTAFSFTPGVFFATEANGEGFYLNGVKVIKEISNECEVTGYSEDFDTSTSEWVIPPERALRPGFLPAETRFVEFCVAPNLGPEEQCYENLVSVCGHGEGAVATASCVSLPVRPLGKVEIVKDVFSVGTTVGSFTSIVAGTEGSVLPGTTDQTANLGFIATITNTGTIPLTNVRATDSPSVPDVLNVEDVGIPPDGVSFRMVQLLTESPGQTSPGVTHSFATGTWTIDLLLPGESASLVAWFDVGANAPDGITFVNNATVFKADQELVFSPRTSEARVTINRVFEIEVSKVRVPALPLKKEFLPPPGDNFPLVAGATVVRVDTANPSEYFPGGNPEFVKVEIADLALTNLNPQADLTEVDPISGFRIPDTEFFFEGNLGYRLQVTNRGPSDAPPFTLLDTLIAVSDDQLADEAYPGANPLDPLGGFVCPLAQAVGVWTWLDDQHFQQEHAPRPTSPAEALATAHALGDGYEPQAAGVTFNSISIAETDALQSAGPLDNPALYLEPSFSTPAGAYWCVDRNLAAGESVISEISFTVDPSVREGTNLINTFVIRDKATDQFLACGDSEPVRVQADEDVAIRIEPLCTYRLLNGNTSTEHEVFTWHVALTSNGPTERLDKFAAFLKFDDQADTGCLPENTNQLRNTTFTDEKLFGNLYSDPHIFWDGSSARGGVHEGVFDFSTSQVHVRVLPEDVSGEFVNYHPENILAGGVNTVLVPSHSGSSPGVAVTCVAAFGPEGESYDTQNGIYFEVENVRIRQKATISVQVIVPRFSDFNTTNSNQFRGVIRLGGRIIEPLGVLPVEKGLVTDRSAHPRLSRRGTSDLVSRQVGFSSGGQISSAALAPSEMCVCISKNLVSCKTDETPAHPFYEVGDCVLFEVTVSFLSLALDEEGNDIPIGGGRQRRGLLLPDSIFNALDVFEDPELSFRFIDARLENLQPEYSETEEIPCDWVEDTDFKLPGLEQRLACDDYTFENQYSVLGPEGNADRIEFYRNQRLVFTVAHTLTEDDLDPENSNVFKIQNTAKFVATGSVEQTPPFLDKSIRNVNQSVGCVRETFTFPRKNVEGSLPKPCLVVSKVIRRLDYVEDRVVYEVVVTNCGNVTLTNVVVEDDLFSEPITIPLLNVGEQGPLDYQGYVDPITLTLEHASSLVDEDNVLTNTVVACADYLVAGEQYARLLKDTSVAKTYYFPFNPDFEVCKEIVAISNHTHITYEVRIKNCGNAILQLDSADEVVTIQGVEEPTLGRSLQASDFSSPQVEGFDQDGCLQIGASASARYELVVPDDEECQFVKNTVTVHMTAKTSQGLPIDRVIAPKSASALTKIGTGICFPEQAKMRVFKSVTSVDRACGTVTYEISVLNCGTIDLEIQEVKDDLLDRPSDHDADDAGADCCHGPLLPEPLNLPPGECKVFANLVYRVRAEDVNAADGTICNTVTVTAAAANSSAPIVQKATAKTAWGAAKGSAWCGGGRLQAGAAWPLAITQCVQEERRGEGDLYTLRVQNIGTKTVEAKRILVAHRFGPCECVGRVRVSLLPRRSSASCPDEAPERKQLYNFHADTSVGFWLIDEELPIDESATLQFFASAASDGCCVSLAHNAVVLSCSGDDKSLEECEEIMARTLPIPVCSQPRRGDASELSCRRRRDGEEEEEEDDDHPICVLSNSSPSGERKSGRKRKGAACAARPSHPHLTVEVPKPGGCSDPICLTGDDRTERVEVTRAPEHGSLELLKTGCLKYHHHKDTSSLDDFFEYKTVKTNKKTKTDRCDTRDDQSSSCGYNQNFEVVKRVVVRITPVPEPIADGNRTQKRNKEKKNNDARHSSVSTGFWVFLAFVILFGFFLAVMGRRFLGGGAGAGAGVGAAGQGGDDKNRPISRRERIRNKNDDNNNNNRGNSR